MAFTTTSPAGVTLAERWAAFRTNMAAAYAKRKMYNVTRTELSNLTNRELADLGIHRSMIKRIALEAAGYK